MPVTIRPLQDIDSEEAVAFRNAGMLKINVALGFQFLLAEIKTVKDLR